MCALHFQRAAGGMADVIISLFVDLTQLASWSPIFSYRTRPQIPQMGACENVMHFEREEFLHLEARAR